MPVCTLPRCTRVPLWGIDVDAFDGHPSPMKVKDADSPQLFPKDINPDFSFENRLLQSGLTAVCGVDEAGRGPLAGPVTAAAVILNPDAIPAGLHDSKKLSEKKREALFDEVLCHAIVSISHVSASTIDRMNIRNASLYAMVLAVQGLETSAQHALIDGNALPPGLPCPATVLVKGDARCLSIAAASITAKVSRDRLMVRAAGLYPEYGLHQHKGYPTKAHRDALMEMGASDIHRTSFAPVAKALEAAD